MAQRELDKKFHHNGADVETNKRLLAEMASTHIGVCNLLPFSNQETLYDFGHVAKNISLR